MNEDDLRTLWNNIAAAMAQGMTEQEINAQLQQNPDLPRQFRMVSTIQMAARGFPGGSRGIEGTEAAPSQPMNRPQALAQMLKSGLTLGTSPIIEGVGEGVQTLLGGEGFRSGFDSGRARERERTQEARAVSPLMGTAAEVVGGAIPSVGGVAKQVAQRVLPNVPRVGVLGAARGENPADAGRQALRLREQAASPAGIESARLGASEFGRNLAGGAAAGAVGGAAYGAGQSDPEEGLSGLLGDAAQGGAFGLGAGLLGGVAAGVARGGMSAMRGGQINKEMLNPRLANQLRNLTDEPLDYGQIIDRAESARRNVSRTMFRPLDELGTINNADLTTFVRQNPEARRAAQEVLQRQGREARLQSGDLEFRDIQAIRRQMESNAQGAARRDYNTARVMDIRDSTSEFNRLVEQALPGEGEARALYRNFVSVPDALDAGRGAANLPPDQIRFALRQYADRPEALKAYRAGLLEAVAGGIQEQATVDTLMRSPDLLGRVQVALGDDETLFRTFVGFAEEAGANARACDVLKDFTKYVFFTAVGSSVLGGALLSSAGG